MSTVFEPIESVDTVVTYAIKISEKFWRWFRRRAVGFNCVEGPSTACRRRSHHWIFGRNFHDQSMWRVCLYVCPIESVDILVTFVFQLCKLRDDFDDDGQLDSIALMKAPSTARRRRNYLGSVQSSMTKVTRVSTLSVEQIIIINSVAGPIGDGRCRSAEGADPSKRAVWGRLSIAVHRYRRFVCFKK